MVLTVTSGRPAETPVAGQRPGGRARRWATAAGLALVPVLATAVGSAAGQVTGLGAVPATLVLAGLVAASALVGLVVLGRSRLRVRAVRLVRPQRLAAAWWCLPLVLVVVIEAATQPLRVTGPLLAAYAVLVAAVAVNEEVWFRGVVLAVLRPGGVRAAVVGTSVLFGVLHLANLAGGQGAAVSLLQVGFAALFGLVAAELAVLTRSLLPAVLWHGAWDLVGFAGGNGTGPLALAGLAAACAVLLGYALVLAHAVRRDA